MKIISWNVNGLRSVAKKGFLSFFEKEDPDILCVQESKAHPEDLDSSLLCPFGRASYFSFADRKGYSGTATYAKAKPVHVRHGIGIAQFDYEGRFVITEHKDFLLFNVYFPNGSARKERHDFKQEFLKRMLRHLKHLLQKKKEIIVLGDYNTAYLDYDVFDPVYLQNTSGFLPEERKWFKHFLDLGFTDCFRHFYPKKKDIYTWWSYREGARRNNRGWRIDHICASSGILKKIKSCKVLNKQLGSDHCPIMIEMMV